MNRQSRGMSAAIAWRRLPKWPEISRLMSAEVGELSVPASDGRGSSSTMPQKRNPVICEAIVEAARNVQHVPGLVLDSMLQEHERGIGHGYRGRAVLCDATRQLSGVVTLATDFLSGIKVNTQRMQVNLGATRGLVHAEAVMIYLSETLGRIKAHHILHQVSQKVIEQETDLQTTLAGMGVDVPRHVFSEAGQIELAQDMIERVLKAHRQVVERGPDCP